MCQTRKCQASEHTVTLHSFMLCVTVVEQDELNDALEQGVELSLPGGAAFASDQSTKTARSSTSSSAQAKSHSSGDKARTLTLNETK